MTRVPKFVNMLRLARLLSDSSPRRWSARELADTLGIHPRSVYRYLLHLDPVLPLYSGDNLYWLETRSPLSTLTLRIQ